MPAQRRETKLGAFAPPDPNAPEPREPEGPAARSVSDVVAEVRGTLWRSPNLTNVWVRGEISGFTAHSSGHWYFSLKDQGSILGAVMWRTANARAKFRPEEGMEVLARGQVDVYPQRSTIQLVVEEVRAVGAGELAVRFEQLRRKLDAEGLFAKTRKRPIPRFPRAIGIVTSLQGAALHDMVHVATMRHPGIRLIVVNARVQGEGSAYEVASGIARLNRRNDIDVIIVGRGGGSAEDLWAFNEEVVVRAVVASRIPIVSGVGHEVDVTLCDLAADLRAATPSNACEVVVPDADALHQQLDDGEERMSAALERIVPEMRQRLDDLLGRATEGVRRTLQNEREKLGADAARLDALSPLAVLARGYAVITKGDATLRRAADATVGDDIHITLQDGALDAKVTKKRDPDG